MPDSLDQYLVGPRSGERGEDALGRFRQVLTERDDAQIVSARPGGPLVVRLSQRAYEQLGEEFATDLIIEPDAPLIY